MHERLVTVEEQIAHLTRTVDDLSEVIARQETELARLAGKVSRLVEREASREVAEGAEIPLADQRPPHW